MYMYVILTTLTNPTAGKHTRPPPMPPPSPWNSEPAGVDAYCGVLHQGEIAAQLHPSALL